MIDFGEWLAENKQVLNEDVFGLFNDSYRCFKNDIDRPAYLLAYQGLMQHVRVTVLTSISKPAGFSDAEWENGWLDLLRDDDKWDKTAFKCTQTKEDTAAGKAAVMNICKEAREKFEFWRQLRNVCAHYKGYDLHRAHTIALYSFIEQYLLTLSVEGSRESLNRQFDDYYNPVLTSSSADIIPLLKKIDSVVQDDEFEVFFKEVRTSCATHARFSSRIYEFIHAVIDNCPRRVKEAVVRYVQSDERFRNDYLETYPEDVLIILSGTDNIHKFWYNQLPYVRKKLIMLALLMEADYIPDSDKKEAMSKCIRAAEEYATSTDYYGINEGLSKVLAEKGFFKIFYDEYFNPDNTSRNAQTICYKTDFYIGVIRLIPWDKQYVVQLIAVFSEQYYPYTLQSRLKEMYREDAIYKAAIDKICADEGLTLPPIIV